VVWKDIKQVKRLENERVIKSGFSSKFSKEKIFFNEKKKFKDFGEVDFEDHQLEEKEKRDIKEMEELERRNLIWVGIKFGRNKKRKQIN